MSESTLAALADVTGGGAAPPRRRIPGEAGIWVFVLGDVTMFAAFFACFVWDRADDVDTFTRSQEEVHITFGAVNTCLLLTGSLFVVWAVQAARRGTLDTARRFFVAALACAAIFGVDKVIEYSDKIAHDQVPWTDSYFMYFYMFTGIHAIHLLIGMIVLAHLARLCRRAGLSAADHRTIEVGATYWHLVDLLWVVLFALLYLMA